MMSGSGLTSRKRVDRDPGRSACAGAALRWVPIFTVVVAASIGGVDAAQAFHIGGGGFRPSMPSIRPSMPAARIATPHVNPGISSSAVSSAAVRSNAFRTNTFHSNAFRSNALTRQHDLVATKSHDFGTKSLNYTGTKSLNYTGNKYSDVGTKSRDVGTKSHDVIATKSHDAVGTNSPCRYYGCGSPPSKTGTGGDTPPSRTGTGGDTPPSKTGTGGDTPPSRYPGGGDTPPSTNPPPLKPPVIVGTGGGDSPPTRRFPPIIVGPPAGGVIIAGPSVPVVPGPVVSGPVVSGPSVPGRSRAGPSGTGPSNAGPSISGRGPSGAIASLPPAGETRFVPNEIVAELQGVPSEQTFRAIDARHRLNRIETQRIGLTNSTWVRWRITDGRSVPVVLRALQADATVRNVALNTQPNYLFAVQQQQAANTPPAEPEGDSAQYALAKLHLPEAQALARGSSVVVGVIDTEIDTAHAELAGAIADSYDAVGVAGPRETHGTGIAGTIAAHAKLLGAAPNVRILAIRAFGSGVGTTFSIVKGLDYAVAHDARVINMSFAGPSDPALSRALGAARSKGSILIAAVGNRGPKSPALYPAADPNVIAVTATDAKDRLFQGANRGGHVAIAAPGVDILVAAPGNSYAMQTGTSFASAYVAGVAALLAERKPDITPDAARNVLMSTARQLGQNQRDPDFGAGLMDAHQALLAVSGRPAADAGH
jgi:subtilase family protein